MKIFLRNNSTISFIFKRRQNGARNQKSFRQNIMRKRGTVSQRIHSF